MKKIREIRPYIMLFREFQPECLRKLPYAFHLLAEFARRARRESGDTVWNGEVIHLEPLEFITGRIQVSKDLGLTEGQYRAAYNNLKKLKLITTIRTTKRYTIGMFRGFNVFDINQKGNLPSEYPSTKPSEHLQLTTNNNDKNDNKYNFGVKDEKTSNGWGSNAYLEFKQKRDELAKGLLIPKK